MRTIPAADSLVTITAPVVKQCPVKHETDDGTVTITYRTGGAAFELHDLAEYLETFAGRHVSHEDFTAAVATELSADVTSTWHTAGMEVRVAVLRQPVN